MRQNHNNQPSRVSKKFTIYVLQLQYKKFYVGRIKTQNLEKRIKQHKDKKGAAWTKIFKVVAQRKQLYQQTDNPYQQDRKVKQMMAQHGINNVRGGSYSQTVDLTPEEVKFILREINGCTDKCFKCSKSEHWVKECPLIKQQNGQISQKDKKYNYLPKCQKCGVYGHYKQNCDYVSFTEQVKNQYKKYIKCWNCHRFGHLQKDCTISYIQDESQSQISYSQTFISSDDFSESQEQPQQQIIVYRQADHDRCYICNQRGHWARDCLRNRQSYNLYCSYCKKTNHTVQYCWQRQQDEKRSHYRSRNKRSYGYEESDDNSW